MNFTKMWEARLGSLFKTTHAHHAEAATAHANAQTDKANAATDKAGKDNTKANRTAAALAHNDAKEAHFTAADAHEGNKTQVAAHHEAARQHDRMGAHFSYSKEKPLATGGGNSVHVAHAKDKQ